MTDSPDLAVWLSARFDAAEQAARAATPGPWHTPGPDTVGQWQIYDAEWEVANATAYSHDDPYSSKPGARGPGYIDPDANAAHIAAHDPSWRLADIVRKRQILAMWVQARAAGLVELDRPDATAETVAAPTASATVLLRVVLLLAAEFADAPGYDEAWRP